MRRSFAAHLKEGKEERYEGKGRREQGGRKLKEAIVEAIR
jgi:hypothetical protein